MLWAYSVGEKPNTITVYERNPGGTLYLRLWDAMARDGKGNWIRKSLKHRDKAKAKKHARAELAKLEEGIEGFLQGKTTMGQVLAAYEAHRTPRKGSTEQKADLRRTELWTRLLGPDMDPHDISVSQWESFIRARSDGSISARGLPVPKEKRQTVRTRTVEYDLVWLSLVFNWASKWRLPSGRYLMRENPVRGFDFPKERNPLRPVASQDRFEAVRAVSDRVLMENRVEGKRESQRSYVSELLDIANGTGRRIRAICQLRYSDLLLSRTPTAPHGAIRWPAETDKRGRETVAPLSPAVRAAIDRIMTDRAGIGPLPLFPAPTGKETPISRHLADAWLREAEELAGLPTQKGSLWHAYRRKWATERKHLPDVDVAAAGGWASLEALKKSYQHADEATMLKVVMGAGELREAL
jgi:hypothetical protein